MIGQYVALVHIAAGSFRNRWKISLVIVLGIACMTLALLPILSLGEGLKLSLLNSGHDDRIVVMAGSTAKQWPGSRENLSRLPVRLAHLAQSAPMLAGESAIDAQVMTVAGPIKKSGQTGSVRLRGLSGSGLALVPELQMMEGRPFKPGNRDLLVGELAAAKFRGMTVGGKQALAGAIWTVTGTFRTGTQLDGDILTDANVLRTVLKRSDDNLLIARLRRPEDFDAFKSWLIVRAGVPLLIQRESEYYRTYWLAIPNNPYIVAYILGGLFGVGALAGTMQATLTMVEGRVREIALLRAIGFGAWPVALCVLLELLALASLGALLGTLAVWLWLDGYIYDAQGVFRITVNLYMLLIGLAWALVVAGAGAMSPVIRLGRMTVAEALAAS